MVAKTSNPVDNSSEQSTKEAQKLEAMKNYGESIKKRFNEQRQQRYIAESKVQTLEEIKEAKEAHAYWFGEKDPNGGVNGGVIQKGKQLTENSLKGLSHWVTLAMDGLSALRTLALAQDADPLNPFTFIPRPAIFEEVIESLPGMMKAQIVEFMSTDKDYPATRHSIAIDDKGRLITKVTSGGEPLPEEEKKLFDMGVSYWLKAIGYKEAPDPDSPDSNIYLDENNKPLTNDVLQSKLADNVSGYTSFLQANLNYENIEELKLREKTDNENEVENQSSLRP